MHREFRSPLLLAADDRSADRIPFAPTAIFDGDDLFAIDTGHVATGEAHQGPADRLVRLSAMQQMLLRLVRIMPHAFGAGGAGTERSTRHLRPHQTLAPGHARPPGPPAVLAVPRTSGLLYTLWKKNVGDSGRPPCLLLVVQRMDAEIQEEHLATERWEIDSSHSSLQFSVRHLVIAKVRGSFARWSGTIQVPDGDFSKATVAVTIDASSIDTGVADRDAHLKSPDFFDAAQHAELRGGGKRVQPRAGTESDAGGDLTIKGITREAVLRVAQNGHAKEQWGNVRAAFTAKTTIDRKDFGLTWNQALETGGVLVGDKVEIEAEIPAVKQVAAQVA